ncbi:MAG: hypothetical protein M3O30_03715 [Planctomycetota bacterium]|nr:hypothetical protein [Planctomycetota bacterium]
MKQRRIIAIEALLIIFAGICASLYFRHLEYKSSATTEETANDATMQVMLRRLEPTLTEIDLLNNGAQDDILHDEIAVSWTESDLASSEALPDFDRQTTGRYSLAFRATKTLKDHPLKPMERRAVGWVRLTDSAPLLLRLQAPATQPD